MTITSLYPLPCRRFDLCGWYLGLELQHGNYGLPLIYANFISSIDGRIAVPNGDSDMQVPEAITNPRDWRLYQELAAQSSVMIVSARYFRQLAAGKAQALLPVEDNDLRTWREQQQLTPQPDLLILSRSLDIPEQALTPFADRTITVLTTGDHNPSQRQRLVTAGVQVVECGEQVDGHAVQRWMAQEHHRSGYAIAGCGVLHTLLTAGVLDRLFLTTHPTLLGGSRFDTLLRDDLPHPLRLRLENLYIDDEEQQLFAEYSMIRSNP